MNVNQFLSEKSLLSSVPVKNFSVHSQSIKQFIK